VASRLAQRFAVGHADTVHAHLAGTPTRPRTGAAGLSALRRLVESLSVAQPAGLPAAGPRAGTWWSVSDSAHLGARQPPAAVGTRGSGDTTPAELDRVRALVTLAQQGDGEAFAAIYSQYVDVVYRYVYYRVGSHHVAEDLTSETFVRALRRLDSFSWTGRDIAAWFVTIARNLVVDHVKSSRYRLEVTTGDMLDGDERAPSTEVEVLGRLRDEQLLGAMRDLKPDQQECLSLRFLQGLSLAETAEVMGRSAGAVKQLQLRAVRSLHRALGGERP
jgi:RNA polymerase sigma-70 factor (TIGR02952 family)